MKKKIILAFCISLLAIISFQTNVFPANWRIKVIDSSALVHSNSRMDITLDVKGFPHIVYGEKTIEYVHLDDKGWHEEQVDAFNDFGSAWPAIAVDGDSKAHIVYRNHEISKLVYTTNASGDWNSVTFDFDAFWPTIAVDSQNTPHLFANLYNDIKTYYITNASGVWGKELIDSNGGDFRIVIDSSDKIHLIYVSYSPYNQAFVNYATNKSGSWLIESISDEGYYNLLDAWQFYVDPDQALHVTYQNSHYANAYPGNCYGDCYYIDFKHASNNSGGWIVEEIASTNHYNAGDDTVPAGTPQYFGVLSQTSPSKYSYLVGSGILSHVILSNGLIFTYQIDQGVDIPSDWFDCIQSLSGAIHIFYYDRKSNNFKYASNSPLYIGDVNSDYVIDLKDPIQTLQVLSAVKSENVSTTDADVNLDEKIGLEELIYLLQRIAGIRPLIGE